MNSYPFRRAHLTYDVTDRDKPFRSCPADFYPHNFRNVPPPPDQLTTPFQPTIPLDSPPFPNAFSDFDLVATSATCKLDGLVTPAAYQPQATVYYWWGYMRQQPAISCVTRASPRGDRNLQVSLDGQHYVTVSPALDQQTDLYSPGNYVTRPDPTALVERTSTQANFTRLPTTSRYCVAFRTGTAAVAALAGLTIDTGDLSPAFDPKVVHYSSTAPPGTVAATLTFAPGATLSSVSVQGVPVALDWSRGAAGIKAHVVTGLTPGWNVIAVEVTAPNGFSLTSYTVDVFVASPCPKGHPKKPPAAACLLSISPEVGPVSGGTRVALQFPAGQLPVSGNCPWCSPSYYLFQPAGNAKSPICNFGGRKVTAEYESWSATSIVCYAPPWDGAAAGGAVELTFSLDGTTFSAAGGRFFYYRESISSRLIISVKHSDLYCPICTSANEQGLPRQLNPHEGLQPALCAGLGNQGRIVILSKC